MIERVDSDVVVWATLAEVPSGTIPVGTPVIVSFQAGLGRVFYVSYLVADTVSATPAQVPAALYPMMCLF